jgi:hypothetical protein
MSWKFQTWKIDIPCGLALWPRIYGSNVIIDTKTSKPYILRFLDSVSYAHIYAGICVAGRVVPWSIANYVIQRTRYMVAMLYI